MKAKMIKRATKALLVTVLVAGVGMSVVPTTNVNASSKAVKQLPKAYRHTWYTGGVDASSGVTATTKLKAKIAKNSYRVNTNAVYGKARSATYMQQTVFQKYTVRKNSNGSYKMVLRYKDDNGVWQTSSTVTMKVVTKKFNGKKYKVLWESNGGSKVYFFKSTAQLKQAKYDFSDAIK